MTKRVKFLLNGKFHEGSVIKENFHTTLVRVRNSKLDILGMTWKTWIRVIKRHNVKHEVRPC